MMRRLVFAALLVLAPVGSAFATNCSSNPFTLTNGQTADATQVMANFNNLLNCADNNLAHNAANSDITSLAGLTTPLSVLQGGTGATTFAANGLIIGNGSSALSTLAPSTSGNLLQSETSGFVSTNVWPVYLPVKTALLTADWLIIADSKNPWQASTTSAGTLVNLVTPAVVQIQERQPSGTGGQTTTSASNWVTHVANVKTLDSANIGTLSSNAVQLPNGTYDVTVQASTVANAENMLRLFNVTGNTPQVDLSGNVIYSVGCVCGASARNTMVDMESRFVVTSGAIALRVEAWSDGSSAMGTDLGAGSPNVYMTATFRKVS